MTEFNFNQTIEYEDCTRDLNFEAARRWAAEHGAAFAEDIAARKTVNGKLMRYFIIGSEPAPVVVEPVPEPTVAELQARKRGGSMRAHPRAQSGPPRSSRPVTACNVASSSTPSTLTSSGVPC